MYPRRPEEYRLLGVSRILPRGGSLNIHFLSRISVVITSIKWDEIPLEHVSDMFSRRLVTGEREMVARIYMKRGCLVPTHSHESEQMTWVLKGALKFSLGGTEVIVREGEILSIPSWLEHSAEALEETEEVDIFSPIRQDWIDKTDAYLRR
jgi:quercetin dioxygenase-like cupin family protein